jgi:hypothetical protein
MLISKAINVLEKTGNPIILFNRIKCDYLLIYSTPNYKRNRAKDLDELKNSIRLCLDYMLLNSTVATLDCRIKH